ncbi:hypothetical protein N0O92_00925 [Alkalihalobacillus sp. MEB130]|uniref:hypothetical protein n=1 Tax=Alkalihalobacillus sp. MEB130 TaxID=2976704 RepID=UPI0028E051DF|nr:hypothetical protein [Alkalihalobacillus sp. MEB130]MDT8858772.1 hypothetical protein [Alkalihalobacillus sp. MEB130]
MNPTFIQLYQISRELLDVLNSMTSCDLDQRDEEIEKVERLLAERGKMIRLLDSPAKGEEELKFANNLVHLNNEIEQKLELIKGHIKSEMDKMKAKKKVNRKYDNPYEMTTNEGAFIDKRSK